MNDYLEAYKLNPDLCLDSVLSFYFNDVFIESDTDKIIYICQTMNKNDARRKLYLATLCMEYIRGKYEDAYPLLIEALEKDYILRASYFLTIYYYYILRHGDPDDDLKNAEKKFLYYAEKGFKDGFYGTYAYVGMYYLKYPLVSGEKSKIKGMKYLNEAAKHNDPLSLLMLAKEYLENKDPSKVNLKEALKYYKLGAKYGSYEAKQTLKSITRHNKNISSIGDNFITYYILYDELSRYTRMHGLEDAVDLFEDLYSVFNTHKIDGIYNYPGYVDGLEEPYKNLEEIQKEIYLVRIIDFGYLLKEKYPFYYIMYDRDCEIVIVDDYVDEAEEYFKKLLN